MKREFRKNLICAAVALLSATAYAQEVPLSAQVHQRTDVIVNGKVVTSLAGDETFYRDSDGSTVTLPAEGHGSNGTLWDNKTGTAYRLNLEKLTAYEDPIHRIGPIQKVTHQPPSGRTMLWRASRAKLFLYTWKALRERLMRNPPPQELLAYQGNSIWN